MGTIGYAAPEYVATGNLVVYFSSGMPQLGVSKFGSVRFLSKKLTKIKIWKTKKFKPEPNQNQFKPTGFGSVRFGFFNRKTGKPVLLLFWAFFGLF